MPAALPRRATSPTESTRWRQPDRTGWALPPRPWLHRSGAETRGGCACSACRAMAGEGRRRSVADHRPARLGQLHADLVGAPGVQVHRARSAAPSSLASTCHDSRARRAEATRVVNRRGSVGSRPYGVSSCPCSGGLAGHHRQVTLLHGAPARRPRGGRRGPGRGGRAGARRSCRGRAGAGNPGRGAPAHVEAPEPPRGGDHRAPPGEDGSTGRSAGLSTTRQSASSYSTVRRGPTAGSGAGGGRSRTISSPPNSLRNGRARLAADADPAGLDERPGALRGEGQDPGDEPVEPLPRRIPRDAKELARAGLLLGWRGHRREGTGQCSSAASRLTRCGQKAGGLPGGPSPAGHFALAPGRGDLR